MTCRKGARMMKTVDMGIYSYSIIGEREEEAAEKLKERIDYLDHLPGVRYYADELSDILTKIAEEYGVEIKV